MFLRYIVNAIIISFLSQKIASKKFFLSKRGHFVSNVMCAFFFEEMIGSILVLANIIGKFNIAENVDVIVLIITIVFFFLLSIACYFIHEFRGTNLNFQDLMSIPTAKEVAGGYSIKIYKRFIIVGIFYILFIVSCIFLYKTNFFEIWVEKTGIKSKIEAAGFFDIIKHGFIIFLLSVFEKIVHLNWRPVFFVLSVMYLRGKITDNPYNYGLFAGEKEGYIYNFFSSIPCFHKNKKDINEKNIYNEYMKAKIEYNKVNSIDISKDKKPHVICIMNESFGTSHKLIKTDVEVTPYYDNLNGVIKGNMYVNTIGGGTCNTEYDFLTYSNVGDFSYPIYPFNNLVKKDMYALPRYFKNLSYKTMAFHPYTKTNYNRHKVYKRFGFDEFIGLDDMSEKSYIRNFISDECMYREVLNRLDKAIEGNEKLFLYGVSIQNHGGYNFFFGQEVKSKDDRFVDNFETIDSYLSLMKKSDDAIHVLIDHIKNMDERIVLLFFGDHNATYDTYINRKIYGEEDIYEISDAYRVPFFIYDNKNIKDEYIDRISPNFLATLFVKSIGLPLDYDMSYMDNLYKEVECMNYHRMRRKSEITTPMIDKKEYQTLQKLFVMKQKNRMKK